MSREGGHVCGLSGLAVHAELPGARRGDWVRIEREGADALDAEVIAFDERRVTLLPLGDLHGVGLRNRVLHMGSALSVRCGPGALGRVVDGVGRPLDGGPPLEGESWPIHRRPPAAVSRPRIARVLTTGVRAIDALCTVGEGQRVGIFAPAGAGKTSLLAQLAEHASADVIVACLIGERGRELNEFLQDALGPRALAKSVVVSATSDTAPLERLKSAHVATTFAEYFRAQGASVLLLVDSLTRLVRAAREVGLAAGEPPARRGFPASAFADLAPLLERAGLDPRGAITAFYTVLVEGNDLDEPVADEVRGLIDGHLVLDRTRAERGVFPALDPVKSMSRLMNEIAAPPHRKAAQQLRAWLAHYELKRDLVELGAVSKGADPLLDVALAKLPSIEALLRQPREERSDLAATIARLLAMT